MELNELIVERLKERRLEYLDEMATEWKNIQRELGSSVTKEILIHLIKLYYWSIVDISDVNHWKDEIYAFYHDIPKLKGKNRYPDKEKIFNTIWEYWGDTFDSIEYSLNDEYDKFPNIKIDDRAIKFCEEYVSWLSERLSISGIVKKSEVNREIDELLLKYNIN